MTMNALQLLEDRGFLYQHTDREVLENHLAENRVTFYVGFDPTADSLHIGHLLPIMAMRLLQRCGHRAIALIGGGTARVGDPSGKSQARPILGADAIAANAEAIKRQMARFIDFAEDRALLVNNADWLAALNYIEFLRDYGRHFSINRMLQAESVKQRLETGLSFLEFNYMLLQAYDFHVLEREHGCTLQLGGQDQWGNIVAGIDLVRRISQREVYGATFPLLLKSDGEKFGKTAGGAVWLDAQRTSPYHYYQFWRNVEDAEVGRLLGFFTNLPMAEVRRLQALPAPAINRAKEILAYEATCLAHGVDQAAKAYLAAGAEFGFADPSGAIATASAVREVAIAPPAEADLPTYRLSNDELAAGLWVVKLLVDAGLCKSNGEARRLIKGGGCYLNGERIADDTLTITRECLQDGQMMLRAGKKNLRRIFAAAPVPTGL